MPIKGTNNKLKNVTKNKINENAFTFNSERPETLIAAIRDVLREKNITFAKTANLRSIAINNTWKVRARTIRTFFGEL